MYARCKNVVRCGYSTGDEGVPEAQLLKTIEEEGGSVDTTVNPPTITCPNCGETGTMEFVA